jgi:predicted O-methyltransferase YrrM
LNPVQVNDALQAYMEGLVAPRDPVLARMEREAELENIPIVGPHEGALLALLVKIADSRRLLELGTATGYSGLWMLKATRGGSLTTFELDHERAERARANFSEAGVGAQALVLEEDALTGLQRLDDSFDCCFIDLLNSFASEEVTRQVLDLCLERLEDGALLMADNALRRGEVVKPKGQNARNVDFYNRMVARHPRLESVIVPVRDGLSVARVRD